MMHWIVRVGHCARTSSCTTARQAHVILQLQSSGSNIFPRIRFVMIYLTCKAFAFFISAFSFWCSPRRLWKAISFQTVEHHPVFDDVTLHSFSTLESSECLIKDHLQQILLCSTGGSLCCLCQCIHEILMPFSSALHNRLKIIKSSTKSHFESLIFHKIHNFKDSFLTKFTFSKSLF